MQRDILNIFNSPDWCGSAGWASSCKAKGHRFYLRSEHTPGRKWVSPHLRCAGEATNQCCSLTLMLLSLSFFFPSHLFKDKKKSLKNKIKIIAMMMCVKVERHSMCKRHSSSCVCVACTCSTPLLINYRKNENMTL